MGEGCSETANSVQRVKKKKKKYLWYWEKQEQKVAEERAGSVQKVLR